ncbi:TPA: hypothetical protein I7730_00585 [Vibrio vulnificus]|uniref:Uncharacterized protein n=1 Tax=Vibrio vulnificus TaxID=672 RepID=A0A8H9K556_VIBVL|nr:hypothetical protein [Vibrio vulnificus]
MLINQRRAQIANRIINENMSVLTAILEGVDLPLKNPPAKKEASSDDTIIALKLLQTPFENVSLKAVSSDWADIDGIDSKLLQDILSTNHPVAKCVQRFDARQYRKVPLEERQRLASDLVEFLKSTLMPEAIREPNMGMAHSILARIVSTGAGGVEAMVGQYQFHNDICPTKLSWMLYDRTGGMNPKRAIQFYVKDYLTIVKKYPWVFTPQITHRPKPNEEQKRLAFSLVGRGLTVHVAEDISMSELADGSLIETEFNYTTKELLSSWGLSSWNELIEGSDLLESLKAAGIKVLVNSGNLKTLLDIKTKNVYLAQSGGVDPEFLSKIASGEWTPENVQALKRLSWVAENYSAVNGMKHRDAQALYRVKSNLLRAAIQSGQASVKSMVTIPNEGLIPLDMSRVCINTLVAAFKSELHKKKHSELDVFGLSVKKAVCGIANSVPRDDWHKEISVIIESFCNEMADGGTLTPFYFLWRLCTPKSRIKHILPTYGKTLTSLVKSKRELYRLTDAGYFNLYEIETHGEIFYVPVSVLPSASVDGSIPIRDKLECENFRVVDKIENPNLQEMLKELCAEGAFSALTSGLFSTQVAETKK